MLEAKTKRIVVIIIVAGIALYILSLIANKYGLFGGDSAAIVEQTANITKAAISNSTGVRVS